jgi:molybdenum cofactor cytidylyltransferase
MIRALLLAAGQARRFTGTQKLLATVPGKKGDLPLVRLAAETIVESRVDEVIVVLGRDAPAVRDALAGLPVRTIVNSAYASGMSASLRAGVATAIDDGRMTGLLVALGDQPILQVGVVDAVVATFWREADNERRDRSIVVPRYSGVRGHPVLFGRAVVPELLALTGDRGARDVVERDPRRVRYVDVMTPAPTDVDTEDDLGALREQLVARAAGRGSSRGGDQDD